MEVACAGEEQVGDYEVERGPEDVDYGRGFTLAGRFGERRGEAAAGDAGDEVWHGVDEESAGEEVGEVGVPGQRCSFVAGVGGRCPCDAWRIA